MSSIFFKPINRAEVIVTVCIYEGEKTQASFLLVQKILKQVIYDISLDDSHQTLCVQFDLTKLKCKETNSDPTLYREHGQSN